MHSCIYPPPQATRLSGERSPAPLSDLELTRGRAGFVGDPTPALSRGRPKGAMRTIGHDVFGVFDSPTGLSRRASWPIARKLQVDRVLPADPDAVSKPPQNKEAC